MSKAQRIKEIRAEIRFFKRQLAELLLESGVLTDLKRLDELEQELIELISE